MIVMKSRYSWSWVGPLPFSSELLRGPRAHGFYSLKDALKAMGKYRAAHPEMTEGKLGYYGVNLRMYSCADHCKRGYAGTLIRDYGQYCGESWEDQQLAKMEQTIRGVQ